MIFGLISFRPLSSSYILYLIRSKLCFLLIFALRESNAACLVNEHCRLPASQDVETTATTVLSRSAAGEFED